MCGRVWWSSSYKVVFSEVVLFPEGPAPLTCSITSTCLISSSCLNLLKASSSSSNSMSFAYIHHLSSSSFSMRSLFPWDDWIGSSRENKSTTGTRGIVNGCATGTFVMSTQSCRISVCITDKFEGWALPNLHCTLSLKMSMWASMIEIWSWIVETMNAWLWLSESAIA